MYETFSCHIPSHPDGGSGGFYPLGTKKVDTNLHGNAAVVQHFNNKIIYCAFATFVKAMKSSYWDKMFFPFPA